MNIDNLIKVYLDPNTPDELIMIIFASFSQNIDALKRLLSIRGIKERMMKISINNQKNNIINDRVKQYYENIFPGSEIDLYTKSPEFIEDLKEIANQK